jgi:hypothetical protein
MYIYKVHIRIGCSVPSMAEELCMGFKRDFVHVKRATKICYHDYLSTVPSLHEQIHFKEYMGYVLLMSSTFLLRGKCGTCSHV